MALRRKALAGLIPRTHEVEGERHEDQKVQGHPCF